MKNASMLAVLFALVLSACGGGGGGTTAPGPIGQAPAPAPTPPAPAPAPAPPPAPVVGTWTAPLSTCIKPDLFARPELGGSSLGHIPCLTGAYYATVIRENTLDTGPRVGKACSVTISLDATFTLLIDDSIETTYKKTVDAVINGVEQSGSFGYGYSDAGSTAGISAIEFWNGGSAQVMVDPARTLFFPFVNPAAKLRIEANYTPTGSTTSVFLVCEG